VGDGPRVLGGGGRGRTRQFTFFAEALAALGFVPLRLVVECEEV
jgi:hypothetical protein